MQRIFARQMIGQRQALGLPGRCCPLFRWCRFIKDARGMGMFGFEILKRQFQLVGHLGDPLGRLTELHPA